MLEVKDLHKSYGRSVALRGTTFAVPRATCYGLLGPNGAGKTTAISIIAGTMDPDAGVVLLDGDRMRVANLKAKRRIGYVPQELALYEELSAQDNLRFFGMLFGLHGLDLNDRIGASLGVAGLNDRRGETVRTFSGGMKRRLNLAASLLHDPDLLILDEPTVGVDPQSRNLIFEALERLIERGKTILYTTHYMEEVERLCERAAILDQGVVIAEGELSELYRLLPTKRLVEVELQAPPSEDLKTLSTRPSNGAGANSLTLEIEDLSRDLCSSLEVIRQKGGVVQNVRTEQPSLEQVFLHLTGRQLRD